MVYASPGPMGMSAASQPKEGSIETLGGILVRGRKFEPAERAWRVPIDVGHVRQYSRAA